MMQSALNFASIPRSPIRIQETARCSSPAASAPARTCGGTRKRAEVRSAHLRITAVYGRECRASSVVATDPLPMDRGIRGQLDCYEYDENEDSGHADLAACRTGDLGWPVIPELFVPKRHLGSGAFGKVFLAENLPGGGASSGSERQDVAVKLLHKENKSSQDSLPICRRENLRREAEVLQVLQGKPHIVELRGLYEDDEFAYITMEACDGDLQGLLDRSNGCIDERVAAGLARQMCRAIRGVHEEKICYTDVKPANFLLQSHDDLPGMEIKLADFGCSQDCDDGCVLTDKTGTPLYTAPEVYAGCYSRAADVWGIGIILYRMLSGAYPYIPFPFRRNLDALPPDSIMNAVVSYDLSFDDGLFDNVSHEARDFLRCMLRRRAEDRITVEEALKHPWLSTDEDLTVHEHDLDLFPEEHELLAAY